MRTVILAVGLLALLWSGYWLYGSRGAAQASRDWFAARADSGWQAGITDIRTRGFPNRFDVTLTGPRLALPSDAAAWSAPFLQVLRLSYQPEHAILIFAPEQALRVGDIEFLVTSDKMQASAVLDGGRAAALDRANLVAEGLALRWRDRTLTAATALAAVRRTPARALGYDLALDLRGVTVRGPDGVVTVERIVLDSAAILTAALTLSEPAATTITHWQIAKLQLGDRRLGGEVAFEASGPSGTLTAEDGDAPDLVALAQALGLSVATAAGTGGDAVAVDIRSGAITLNGVRPEPD